MATECWCGRVHPADTDDPGEAWAALWHAVAAVMRIPQLADWLSRKLPPR